MTCYDHVDAKGPCPFCDREELDRGLGAHTAHDCPALGTE